MDKACKAFCTVWFGYNPVDYTKLLNEFPFSLLLQFLPAWLDPDSTLLTKEEGGGGCGDVAGVYQSKSVVLYMRVFPLLQTLLCEYSRNSAQITFVCQVEF